jgi:hypothetical protein
MSDFNLLHLITSYGTRKNCPMDEIRKQYGTHHIQEMNDDLERLENQGKIEILKEEVWLKKGN